MAQTFGIASMERAKARHLRDRTKVVEEDKAPGSLTKGTVPVFGRRSSRARRILFVDIWATSRVDYSVPEMLPIS